MSPEGMSSTPGEGVFLEDHPTTDGPLPAFIDWILGAVIALSGVLSILVGSALAFLVDREMLAEGVEDGTITVTAGTAELTDPETVEVVRTLVTWTGIGFVVTGLGMLLFAAWYVRTRHRAQRRARTGEHVSSYTQFAVLGAATTVVTSFVPFSPALGGALAGYLERGESDRTVSVGALAGLLPLLPALVLLVFVLGGVVAGLLTVEQVGAGLVVGGALFFVVLLVASLGAGLGALGGYVGGRFAGRRAGDR